MKKFATLTLVFSLPVVLLLVVFESSLRHIPNDYSYKRHYLDTKSNEIEVLYLGNSHIYYGINPEYSKFKGFNAAHVLQSFNYDFAILEKYKKNLKNLKCIVIPVDYFSFYLTIETGIEKWRVKNYNIYYGLEHIENNEGHFELTTGKFSANFMRLSDYYKTGKNDISCNRFGWGTYCNSKKGEDLNETAKSAAKRHTIETIDKKCYGKNLNALYSIINLAKARNIKVIFVTCPAYQSYVRLLNQKQLKNTIDLINKICSENNNTAYYNLMTDKSYIAGDFYDADHLNEIGAKKLTLELDNLIIQTLSK